MLSTQPASGRLRKRRTVSRTEFVNGRFKEVRIRCAGKWTNSRQQSQGEDGWPRPSTRRPNASDEELSDWNRFPAAPRVSTAKSSRPPEEVPALFGVARANRKKPTLNHHWLGPELTAYRSSSGERPLVISSLGKRQNRIVYTVSNNVVMGGWVITG